MAYLRLVWVNSKTEEEHELIAPTPISIGRSTSNDIVIKHGFISRRHARISAIGDDIIVTDLNSRNGVVINDQRITEARVANGGSFEIGTYTFTCTIQVKCTNETCQRFVDSTRKTCPWCGHFLADAYTHLH